MLTERTQKVIESAISMAATWNHEFVTLEHILLALAQDNDIEKNVWLIWSRQRPLKKRS